MYKYIVRKPNGGVVPRISPRCSRSSAAATVIPQVAIRHEHSIISVNSAGIPRSFDRPRCTVVATDQPAAATAARGLVPRGNAAHLVPRADGDFVTLPRVLLLLKI